jgi:hypothetical protein
MASSFLTNFVGGVADYGLDQIKSRQAAEADLKKTKLLNQLRTETEKEMAVFNNNLQEQNTDSKASGPDLVQGVYIYRDKNGTEKSRRPLTDTEKKEMALEVQKGELDIENVKSTIASRGRDDARADQTLSLDRLKTQDALATGKATRASLDGTKNSGTGAMDDNDAAMEILYGEKDLVNQARQHGLLQSDIEEMAVNITANSKSKAEAAKKLRDMLRIQLRFTPQYTKNRTL